MSTNRTLHYGVIAIPSECSEEFLKAADENSHYIEFEFSYSEGDIDYYHIYDNEENAVAFCEDLANLHGIPHNLFPNRLNDLAVIARFTPQGDLIEYYTDFSSYIQCMIKPEEIDFYSPKVPLMYEWENNWENQVHYGRVGLLKRQLEGK